MEPRDKWTVFQGQLGGAGNSLGKERLSSGADLGKSESRWCGGRWTTVGQSWTGPLKTHPLPQASHTSQMETLDPER